MIVIGHDLDVIKLADYIIDMGPDGGTGGGHVVVEGTPEKVALCKNGFTARYLRKELEEATSLKAKR